MTTPSRRPSDVADPCPVALFVNKSTHRCLLPRDHKGPHESPSITWTRYEDKQWRPDMEVQNVPRIDVPRCECPEAAEHGGKPCKNAATLYDDVLVAPSVCTPCLYGCLP